MEVKINNDSVENLLKNIKNKYILKQIITYIEEKILLKIIKYNKTLQGKFDISIGDYKKYFEQIEIEIIPIVNKNKKYFY